jgi:hypothetical protein
MAKSKAYKKAIKEIPKEIQDAVILNLEKIDLCAGYNGILNDPNARCRFCERAEWEHEL